MQTKMQLQCLITLLLIHQTLSLVPPKFQWKTIDFAWEKKEREKAIANGTFIPENNMPTGIARWRDKLFITIPRWKNGVPSSLNFVYLNGTQDQRLNPYPNWSEAYLSMKMSECPVVANSTVVSTFRVHVDYCNRLWVVDNGVADMANDVTQISEPAILVFDLVSDKLSHRYVLPDHVLLDSSAFTSIVVDTPSKHCTCKDAFVYIADMGSNAILVYSLKQNSAWRVENRYFAAEPDSGLFRVGGIDFFWKDGVSSLALSKLEKDGNRYVYLHPTASTKQFRISTKLLRRKYNDPKTIRNGVENVGDRGPKSQATALAFDDNSEVLFFTQLNKNGLGCWNTKKSFQLENTPVILSDCSLLEFPNDVKVDHEGNLWILSDRQSRFLYDTMDFNEVNFRILTASINDLIRGTTCDKLSFIQKTKGYFSK